MYFYWKYINFNKISNWLWKDLLFYWLFALWWLW